MVRVVVVESVDERVLVSDMKGVGRGAGFWGVKRRSFSVTNTKGLKLERGDFVEIFLPTGRTVLQSMIVFLLPLILFPVAYGLAVVFVPGNGDGVLFLVGFGALLLGFPLGDFLCRIVGAVAPNVSKVLISENVLKSDGSSKCGVCADFDCRMRG